jgi:3-oxoacyl-[acyl-carrier-protein] synthase II
MSALGDRTQTWQGILAQRSGLQLHAPFADLPPYPLGLIGAAPTLHLKELTQKLVIAALEDAGLSPPLERCGIVVGSSRHHQGCWESYRRSYSAEDPLAHPAQTAIPNWLEMLPGTLTQATLQIVGGTGPVLSPMAACATGVWAIAQAYELIQTGQCDRVIAGAVELPITPLTLAGFQQAGALAKTGCYPFTLDREGLALGEGGAILVLEAADDAVQRHASPYGKILGFGLSADAHHVSAPDPTYRAASQALQHCLRHACLAPQGSVYIHAHGTGTILNDQMEATLIQQWLPQAWVSSTKGATGHLLGASAAVGIAISCLTLQQQILPPFVSLARPAFNLRFVPYPSSASIDAALCFSFGFGGQNGVLALGALR